MGSLRCVEVGEPIPHIAGHRTHGACKIAGRLLIASLGACIEFVKSLYRGAQLRSTQSGAPFKINSNGNLDAIGKANNVGILRQFCRSGQSLNDFTVEDLFDIAERN